MSATIALKLGGLLFKQLVKPVAKGLKDSSKTRPWLKDLCTRVGNWQNRISMRATVRLMGHTPTRIKPLSPDEAFQVGANFLGEVMVFTSGVLVVLVEFTRKSRVDAAKAKKAKDEKARLKQAEEDRFHRLETKIDLLIDVKQRQNERIGKLEASIRSQHMRQRNSYIAWLLGLVDPMPDFLEKPTEFSQNSSARAEGKKGEEIRIVRATEGMAQDLTQIVNWAYRGKDGANPWTSEKGLIQGNRIDLEDMKRAINRQSAKDLQILAAVDHKGHVMGSIKLERTPDGRAEFGMFAVDPEAQSLGIGRRLLSSAEVVASKEWGVKEGVMYCLDCRENLQKWYERRGYRWTGKKVPFPEQDKVITPLKNLQFNQLINSNLMSTGGENSTVTPNDNAGSSKICAESSTLAEMKSLIREISSSRSGQDPL
ncbi:hypothetical protein AAMO2058_001025400 [Amorphochlora amoebiformis]